VLVRWLDTAHLDRQHMALRLHEDVPRASPDVFSGIVTLFRATNHTGCEGVALTHRRTQLGVSALRMPSPCASGLQNVPHTPSRSQRRTDHCTVPQAGTSWGPMRQGQPLRKTERLALTMSRRSYHTGGASAGIAGIKGSSRFHCASVTLDGDAFRLMAFLFLLRCSFCLPPFSFSAVFSNPDTL
jgi:hypothetical protein